MIAIASAHRKTNPYINEWVAWHLSLGFDKVFIYNDNDADYPYIGNFIDSQYKDRVEIIPAGKEEGESVCSMQTRMINDFIQQYARKIDWCAFIDSDEFIHIDSYSSVQEWLAAAPKEVECIALNWCVYGDDEVIEGDESLPVQSRFKQCKNGIYEQRGRYYHLISKKFIRLSKDIKADDMFIFRKGEERLPMYDCNFYGQGLCAVMLADSRYNCYINHYITKSLSECIKYKEGDLWGYQSFEDYYFSFNERTPEKEEYIQAHYKK
jgi:hypothetical protein